MSVSGSWPYTTASRCPRRRVCTSDATSSGGTARSPAKPATPPVSVPRAPRGCPRPPPRPRAPWQPGERPVVGIEVGHAEAIELGADGVRPQPATQVEPGQHVLVELVPEVPQAACCQTGSISPIVTDTTRRERHPAMLRTCCVPERGSPSSRLPPCTTWRGSKRASRRWRAWGYEPVRAPHLGRTHRYLAGTREERGGRSRVGAPVSRRGRGLVRSRWLRHGPLPRCDRLGCARGPAGDRVQRRDRALLRDAHAGSGNRGPRPGAPLARGPQRCSRARRASARFSPAEPVPRLGGRVLVGSEPFRATGPLVGGNLCVLASLCGTPWALEAAGAIVLLEEIAEQPYKVDRLLTQLVASGAFEGVRGFALGTFLGSDAPSGADWSIARRHQRGARTAGRANRLRAPDRTRPAEPRGRPPPLRGARARRARAGWARGDGLMWTAVDRLVADGAARGLYAGAALVVRGPDRVLHETVTGAAEITPATAARAIRHGMGSREPHEGARDGPARHGARRRPRIDR